MGDTKIEWAEKTWNPVRGCNKISPGCKHCYAETFAERWRGIPGHAYEQGFDLRLVPEKLAEPLKWKKPARVFVNSMSDLFHEEVPDEYILRVLAVMAICGMREDGNHTFIVLTKRAERMRRALAGSPDQWRSALAHVGAPMMEDGDGWCDDLGFRMPWPLPNVILGVTVEDRKHGVPRIDVLRKTPAVRRVLSIEPLIEDIGELDLRGIHWVIVGGESGPGARPCALEWIASIVRQCRKAKVPVFVKQLGAYVVSEERRVDGQWAWRAGLRDKKGGDPFAWPADLRVREWPEVAP